MEATPDAMSRTLRDETLIRRLIDRWALWRDGGDWDRLATLWHPGGTMRATWFDGAATDFIKASHAAYDHGVNVIHALGGSAIDITGGRAVAITRMTITQRTAFQGQAIDAICTGRFVDLLSRRDRHWGLNHRRCIYDSDRIVAVVPGEPLQLEPSRLSLLPEGYRHLGYLQTEAGLTVATDLPGRSGPAFDALSAQVRDWLDGG